MDFERIEKMPRPTRKSPLVNYPAALEALREGPIRFRVPEGKKADCFANTITAGLSRLGAKVSRSIQGGFVYLTLMGMKNG